MTMPNLPDFPEGRLNAEPITEPIPVITPDILCSRGEFSPPLAESAELPIGQPQPIGYLKSISTSPSSTRSAQFEYFLQNDLQAQEMNIFYERHYKAVYIFACHSTLDPEDAFDAVQDAFEYFIKRWPVYRKKDENERRNNLYTCVRHRLIDKYRKRKKHQVSSLDQKLEYEYALAYLTSLGPEEIIDNQGFSDQTLFILQQLAPQERLCLLLYSQDFSCADIGKILHIKKTTVGSYVSDAKQKFRWYQADLNNNGRNKS